MATPAEIERQVQFEREAIRQGIAKLHKNTADLEDKSYASASVYGCSSIQSALPLIIKRLENTRNAITKGRAGRTFREIRQYLEPIDPAIAATIALKITFDKVFSNADDDPNRLVSVTEGIGMSLEQEAQMQYYERECPGLLNSIKKNYWKSTTGTQQKFVVVRTMINRHDDVPKWNKWLPSERAKLGGWLLDAIMEETGWFTIDQRYTAKKRTDDFVIPTPLFASIKDQLIANAELFSPIAYPMLIEPNNWTNERAGGYLLNEVMRGHDMVRRGNGPPIQGETPIDFLNKIQQVAFKLNPFTLMVADHLMEKGISIGKFIPVISIDTPAKPPDIDSNKESLKEWKHKCRDIMNENAGAFKRSCRTRMTMQAVDLFRDKDKFFIPWSFDYRGRAYPIPAFLTPQDTDFGKSLLKFYEESFMNEYAEEWLAFQVATTYGLDKAPINERLEWTRANYHLIASVAEDPIRYLPEWEAADEPWQFLAACDEYYHCVIKCDRNYTSLPVATDATCSGLQILAGLCRDAGTAALVNVLPAERPQDAYATVAEHCKPDCPVNVQPYMNRTTVKRVVMTIPYNAKPFSNRDYIRKALKEQGYDPTKEELTVTVKAVRDSMDVIVPGPMAVMSWIEREVAKAIKSGATMLQWVTPSGFIVNQKLNKKDTETIRLQLLGTARKKITVANGDTDEVDLSHHKAATAPNLIHSLDASLLHLSALRFDAPIALIHDSVLCRATDMSSLSSIVRDVYMHLFAEHDYLQSWADQIGAETEPPMINTLKPESVIESTYFFC